MQTYKYFIKSHPVSSWIHTRFRWKGQALGTVAVVCKWGLSSLLCFTAWSWLSSTIDPQHKSWTGLSIVWTNLHPNQKIKPSLVNTSSLMTLRSPWWSTLLHVSVPRLGFKTIALNHSTSFDQLLDTHPICSLWLFIPRFWPFPSELQDIKSEMCEQNLSKIKSQLPFSFLVLPRQKHASIHSLAKTKSNIYIDNEDCLGPRHLWLFLWQLSTF